VLNGLSYVKAKTISPEKAQLMEEIKEAVENLALVRKGKMKADLQKTFWMNYKVLTIPPFDKQLKKLAKKYPSLKQEFASLISYLEKNPDQGISLGHNCYKIRLSISSKWRGKGYYKLCCFRAYRFSPFYL
jgi:mRNA-degrading endonuclease RelE of RelBE toxin-antitoxin system